jgi:tRNA(adenine34) deaminase
MITNVNDSFINKLITVSINEAKKAYKKGDIPVAAIIFKNTDIISKAHNCTYHLRDCSLHAEMVAIRKACKKLNAHRLDGYSIFTTLEPCSMCAGAIVLAHLEKVLILTPDPKAGACGSALSIIPNKILNHSPITIFLPQSDEYTSLLKNFFENLRK